MGLFGALTAPVSGIWSAGAWAFKGGTLRGRALRGGLRTMGPTMFGAAVGGGIGAFRGDVSGEARLGEIFKHAAVGAIGGAGLHTAFKFGRPAARAAWKKNLAMGREYLRIGERAADAAFIGPRLPGGLISPVKEGAKSSIFARRMAEFGASPLVQGTKGFAGAATKGAFRAGRFTFEHPMLVGGAALAVGGGLYAAGRGGATPGSSPTMSGTANISYNQQAITASEIMGGSIAPMGFVGGPQEMQQYQEYQTYRQRLANSAQGLVQGLHRGRHG